MAANLISGVEQIPKLALLLPVLLEDELVDEATAADDVTATDETATDTVDEAATDVLTTATSVDDATATELEELAPGAGHERAGAAKDEEEKARTVSAATSDFENIVSGKSNVFLVNKVVKKMTNMRR